MSDYPEWQSAAREAYRTFADLEAAERAEEDKKTNASHAYMLKSLLQQAGIDAEPTSETWEKDGYTFSLWFDFHLFIRVTCAGVAQDYYNEFGVYTGVTIGEAWEATRNQTPLEADKDLKINLGKTLYEIDQKRQKQAKTDVHVVAVESAVRVMSPLEEHLLNTLRMFVVNAVSELEAYDEDRPY